ncbi:cation diffusion facilitator family transporter [Kitasatospora sp. NBC_00240]|uniref:cation diffusion facilitator family transporter n=1 Tax=Kitasatospora sp. NBC_00240 TaxID=2903567 RepID=UPI00224CE30B|nr:cation diffusion facilitator family transporter [Kitasatospora sp. NBC_00240]MCX5212700.1 cation diffusion facilitator family transporter [Kitasatospora sp. NBC_00240]
MEVHAHPHPHSNPHPRPSSKVSSSTASKTPSQAPPDSPPEPHAHGGRDHSHERGHGAGDRAAHGGRGHRHPDPHGRLRHRLGHLLRPHSHEAADKVDAALESSAEGLRTLRVSLLVLGVTALAQGAVVLMSGSVALLGDTVHNLADALTALPLGIAFLLGRRAADRRYTYGYGRAEDLAGAVIVLTVAASAVFAAVTAFERLLHPQPATHLWAVAGAGLVGCLGNEWVARYRIRTGRRIGSAALVADGLHARTDGLTSLAVLVGAAGAGLGLPWADPLVGLLITAAILAVLRGSVREIGHRLMDAVDPALVDAAERALRAVDGVRGVGALRMRWIGHVLRAEAEVVVDGTLSVVAAHRVAEAAERALMGAVPRLLGATVHIDHEPPG